MLDQSELLAPFVLGVGSDLDIYYEIFSKNDEPLTNEQIAAGNEISVDLVNYINVLENTTSLRDNHHTIKYILLLIADVKAYHASSIL